jgi:hypothetical protein
VAVGRVRLVPDRSSASGVALAQVRDAPPVEFEVVPLGEFVYARHHSLGRQSTGRLVGGDAYAESSRASEARSASSWTRSFAPSAMR